MQKAYVGIILALVGYLIYQRHLLNEEHDSVRELSQKVLSDGTVRSSTQSVSQDRLEEAISKSGIDLNQVKSDGKSLGYVPTAVVTNTVKTQEVTVVSKSDEVSSKKIDGVEATTHKLNLVDSFGSETVPLGTVEFTSPSLNPWKYTIFAKSLSLSTVLSQNEDDKIVAYSKINLTVQGKSIVIPIDSSDLLQAPKPYKWYFSPGLQLSGNYDFRNGLGLGLSGYMISYGQKRSLPDITVLNVGLGSGSEGYLFLNPVNYRIGKHIKYLENTFLGAGIYLNGKTDLSLGLSVSVKL